MGVGGEAVTRSRRKRWLVLVLSSCLVIGAGFACWGQLDAVRNTRTLETFASIQEAVDDADTLDGDAIEIDSLEYDSGYEPGATPHHLLYIEKSVTIYSTLGPADTTVDALGWPCAIELAAPGCTLDGLAFVGSTERAVVCSADGAVLNELIVRPSDGDAIVVDPGTRGSLIQGCVIDDTHHAPCVPDIEWIGIRLNSSSDNVIRGNDLIGACYAIALFGDCDRNLLEGNRITGAEAAAIRLGSSYSLHHPGDPWHNTVVGNTLLGNNGGIALKGNADLNTIANNYVEDHSWDGIHLSPSDEDPGDPVGTPDLNTIFGNVVLASQHGIFLASANGNTLERNEVFDSQNAGISLHDDSGGNSVLDNVANQNGVVGIHVIESDGNTLLRNTANGNHWGGIGLNMSSDTLVQGNVVQGATNPEGTGISISTGINNRLLDNLIEDCWAGFAVHPEFGPASGNVVAQNHVERVEFGIFLSGTENAVTENSFIEFYRTGIQPMGSDHLVADNVLVGASGSMSSIFVTRDLGQPEDSTRIDLLRNTLSGSRWGITLYRAQENLVQGNTITGHDAHGILLSLASSNAITENAVNQNGCGLGIPWSNAEDNVIRGNDLTGNANGAVLTSAPSSFFTSSQALVPVFDNLGNEYLGNTPDSLTSCAQPLDVALDVKPCSCPNPLNTTEKGVLPAAVLGSADLDVRQIDASTLTLGGVPLLRDAYEDVATPFEPYTGKMDAEDCGTEGPDGFEDLVLKFNPQEIVAALGAVADRDIIVLGLHGFLFDGTPVFGEDVILILDEATKPKGVGGPRTLQIMAAPNPASEEGLEFWIEGIEAGKLRVEIYDLAGELIFDSGIQVRPTFVWPLITEEGEDVANGIYLCRIAAMDEEGAILSVEVRTVAVLR